MAQSFLIASLFLALIANTTGAESGVAIQGYSPVSYFTRNKAEKGDPEYAVEYEGRIYHLASQGQVEIFQEDPEKYVPLFSEYCPYSLTLGRQVRIDPERFKIVGDQLLLFHNSEEMDGLKRWNREGNDQEMLKRANQEFLRRDL